MNSWVSRGVRIFRMGALLAFVGGVSTVHAAPLRVGVVLDKGGKDDKSFNAAAVLGANQAKDKLSVQVKFVEASDDNAYEPMIRAFAQKDFDLVIAVGISQADALKKVAPQFPLKKFAIVDSEVQLPNVRSLMFEEHEGSFLVGVIAAMASKSGKIGFIGGMDIPLIRRFEMGYFAGAKIINPKIKTVSNYIGVTTEAWNNPPKAKELAVTQYEGGADVVFAAAGASNAGLFDASEEKGKLSIGVDSNQNWIKPGFVLTSMLKRVDQAVFSTCEDLVSGKFTAGVKRFGLASGGIDFALDQHNDKLLTADMRTKAAKIKADIIAGKTQVPDYYKKAAKR